MCLSQNCIVLFLLFVWGFLLGFQEFHLCLVVVSESGSCQDLGSTNLLYLLDPSK